MIRFIPLSFSVLLVFSGLCGCAGAPDKKTTPTPDSSDAERKKLEPQLPAHAQMIVFVLTRGPNAAPVIRSLVALKKEMGTSLDLSIMYLGMLDGRGQPDPTIIGQAEIESARLQLCVQIENENNLWYDFLECIYNEDTWRTLPLGWQDCAKKTQVNVDKVESCLTNGRGDEALSQSYAIALSSQISSSPTLIIDRKLYMGLPTKEAISTYFCHAAGSAETRPAACAKVAPPPVIAATLLYDSRCTDPTICDVSQEKAVLKNILPGLKMTEIDFTTDEGRHMFDLIVATNMGVRGLPLIVLDENITRDPGAMGQLGDYLIPFGAGYLLSMSSGWDPLLEICTNEIDDTGNGQIDCDDPSCKGKRDCRPQKTARLDLFFMSGCPFSAELLPVADRVLDHFGRKRKQLDLRLQFIGGVKDEDLVSMHGKEEVDEDLRMICAQKLYGKKYRFMEYVVCRAKSFDSPAWEQCLPKWMNKKRLLRCAEGDEGKKLLKKSFKLAEFLGIQGSPTWLLNNRLSMDGRTEEAIKENFCRHNNSNACKKPIAPSPKSQIPPQATDRCQ
jgi:hypothetical protein